MVGRVEKWLEELRQEVRSRGKSMEVCCSWLLYANLVFGSYSVTVLKPGNFRHPPCAGFTCTSILMTPIYSRKMPVSGVFSISGVGMMLMGGMCPMDEAEAIDIVLLLGLMKKTGFAGHVFLSPPP